MQYCFGHGRGAQKGNRPPRQSRWVPRVGGSLTIEMFPKTKMELVVRDGDVEKVCDIIMEAFLTGEIGDGKSFISNIEQVIRVRTGEKANTRCSFGHRMP